MANDGRELADGFFYFRRPGADPAAILLERSYSDIGGVVRIGPPLGRLALVGGSISFEDESPGKVPIIVTERARHRYESGADKSVHQAPDRAAQRAVGTARRAFRAR